ncbi:MAG: fused MFS/spermidine synthase [Bosea sp. (in: a-proteobacteria)]
MSQVYLGTNTQQVVRRIGLAVPAFTIAIGLSAFLLFSIQPMFTKIVLPTLGGSPGVWSVAMVFFQAMLLAGYGYAHVLTTRLAPRTAALVHVAVMLIVLVVALPIGLTTALGEPPADGTTMWLLAVFTLSVGLPFFVVSAHGPLLQAWFARTGHENASEPYFLYAASNAGSLVALLSFPFLVEPLLSSGSQTKAWSFGFALLIAGVATCAAFLPSSVTDTDSQVEEVASNITDAPTMATKLTWCLLAFVPSGLLVAVTAHISTDVAAAPLLWVLPLSLFLLTFIITFQARPWLSHKFMLAIQPGLVVATFGFGTGLVGVSVIAALVLTLAAFFATAMVFHGEIVRLRPAARHLTGFYVWMSVGGVLGGIFAGLLAPHVFNGVHEYSLLFFAALVVRVKGCPDVDRGKTLLLGAGIVGLITTYLVFGKSAGAAGGNWNAELAMVTVALAMLGIFLLVKNFKILAIVVTPIMLMLMIGPYFKDGFISVRSFFGVSKISTSPDGTLRYLAHGTTYHGAQRLDQYKPGVRPDPLTYYYQGGPFDQTIEATRAAKGGYLANVAVVGLGTGSQACLKQAGENWTFYEIDPLVVKIAQDPKMFTFMSECAPFARVVLGDARLMLQGAPPAKYDLIIVDAFSSDSIPLHLLTREAIELYRSKLTAGGALVFHLSNRNLTIAPFAAATAASLSLQTWQSYKQGMTAEEIKAGKASTNIAIVTDNREVLTQLVAADTEKNWRDITPAMDGSIQPWTDDFSNILKAAWLKFNENRQPVK